DVIVGIDHPPRQAEPLEVAHSHSAGDLELTLLLLAPDARWYRKLLQFEIGGGGRGCGGPVSLVLASDSGKGQAETEADREGSGHEDLLRAPGRRSGGRREAPAARPAVPLA